jgi:hypothetical protein
MAWPTPASASAMRKATPPLMDEEEEAERRRMSIFFFLLLACVLLLFPEEVGRSAPLKPERLDGDGRCLCSIVLGTEGKCVGGCGCVKQVRARAGSRLSRGC